MEIKKNLQGSVLTVAIEGRLDTNTSPMLEQELDQFDKMDELVFDLAKLEYISSAGLRVLVYSQKMMTRQGKSMIIRNASDEIKDIFEVTGLIDVMNIE